MRRNTRRLLAAISAATMAVGGTVIAAMATATPQAARAAASPTASLPAVTVRPDPSYQGQPFEGWGTSLVWFANVTGGYPDEVREKLAEMLFGSDGLNLNIARYNVGGGNAPDVPDYLRPGGAVPGWWRAPAGTTRNDKDWWDPENPDHWNWNADQNQRWWINRIKNDVSHWEAFSNSPPYFQTVSGYVSGGFNATDDQLRTESIDDFNTYLVRVVEEVERAHGIKIDTLDPFNEPNTNYWSTRLNAAGEPIGGRQEGAHIGPELQQQVIRSLAQRLQSAETDAVISAMDETNPGLFATNWNSYPDDVRAKVSQLNVHTYGTGQRATVRDIAKGDNKPLWMSEVDGSWGNGQNFVSMAPGLGIAQRMVDDLRELEPTAWVFWQPVEDYNNMKPGGESPEGANWGSIQIPFDCTAQDTLATCPIYTNTKFHTARNFTHFIRPGDRLVKVNDTNSVAAISTKGAKVVYVNSGTAPRSVTIDLSAFGTVSPDATATPVITSAGNALKHGEPVAVNRKSRTVTVQVPAESVSTFLIDGVSGVAKDAPLIQDGHVYRIEGVQSGKSLTPASTTAGAVIRTTDPTSAAQLWRVTELSGGDSNRARYSITTAAGDRQAAVQNGALTLVEPQLEPDRNRQWILSTTGNGTYTFVNVGSGRVLDVGGSATNDGASVSVWLANSADNQRWKVIDETVQDVQKAEVFTTPRTVPTMPTTVVPEYRDGPRGTLPVTWEMPADQDWSKPKTVNVAGVAIDPRGRQYPAKAVVTVDNLVSTQPARAKTYVGGQPDLPAQVTAVGSLGGTVARPVTWETPAADAFDHTGVVTLSGQADAGDGRALPATVRVQVTEPAEENATLAAGTSITATYTEPGYSTAGLRNGDLTDKAWSNWKPGTKNTSDAITITLPKPRTVSHVATAFYRDGSWESYAQSLKIQARNAQGAWVDVSGSVTVPLGGATAPVVDVPVTVTTTDAVRVVLTARTDTHMTISEIQVFAYGPGTSSDARAETIAVNGTEVPGFDPDTTSYQLPVQGTLPQVTAVAADPYATVAVDQADTHDDTATVSVASEDGSQSRTYRIELQR
ncbi:O-glycosyl hydrolase [Micromonospora kangleipakensis]|uniref:O-glycosyl hydrolase n=1 Tax=Micromonospora kangleipakensis TaxID=1077942 RepID=A0A4Q8BAX9_9ACTN|nr:glycoside hydrolase [Micromonospora kangleipakensis]RZU74365.1 O-glycosyl hydrolase [Micromonospora kangleipakensis]